MEDLREVIADLLGADADDDDGRLAGRFGIFAVSDAAKEMPAFTFSHGASSFGLRLHPSDQGDDRFQVSVPSGGGPAAQEILVPGQTLLVPIRLEGQPVLLAVALALLPDRSTTADLEAVQEEFWAQVGGVVAAPMALHVGQHEDEG